MNPSNPPAFPFKFTSRDEIRETIHFGATLRDYFAAKAMQAMAPLFDEANPGGLSRGVLDALAVTSYECADAMLRQREKA